MKENVVQRREDEAKKERCRRLIVALKVTWNRKVGPLMGRGCEIRRGPICDFAPATTNAEFGICLNLHF